MFTLQNKAVLKILNLRLRDLREDNDLKQQTLANLLNCSQVTYSRYETGSHEIPLHALIKLSEYYHTSVDYLLGLTDDPRPYPRKKQK